MSTTPTAPLMETPVYLSFSVFKAAVQNLRAHGLPPKIDRTAFNSRSGSEQGQIISGFKFLKFIDESGQTQSALRKLVDSTENSAEEKTVLAEVLRRAYDKVFTTIDLTNATPGQFENVIGSYGVKGATKSRAVRFFLKAAQFAGISLSTRLTMGLRDRNGGTAANESIEEELEESGQDDNDTTTVTTRRRRRRSKTLPGNSVQNNNPSQAPGNLVKVITLRNVNGPLTLTGGFNAFDLDEEERKLVYDIIDLMKRYEQNQPTQK